MGLINLGEKMTNKSPVEIGVKTIPGVGSRYGEVLIAETGIDIVKRFENAQSLQSFAVFDPSKTYSANKVRSKKTKKGNKHIHTVTIQITQAMLQHGKKEIIQ